MVFLSDYPETYRRKRHEHDMMRNASTMGPIPQGSIYCQVENTAVYVTAVVSKHTDAHASYFPFMVDFRQSFGAGGKIAGSAFMKKEGRPSDRSILMSRLIDRSFRPLFDDSCRNSMVVTITPLSIDKKHDPSVISLIGTSLALSLAGVSLPGYVAACTIGYIDGQFVINPTEQQLVHSQLHLTVAGMHDTITMVECDAKEVPQEIVVQGFALAQQEIARVCEEQEKFMRGQASVTPFVLSHASGDDKEICLKYIMQAVSPDDVRAIFPCDKVAFDHHIEQFVDRVLVFHGENDYLAHLSRSALYEYIFSYVKGIVREDYLAGKKRIDGRGNDEIRPLRSDVNILPIPHGSALFTRGMTQAISITTLGGPDDVLVIDSMQEDSVEKRFFHDYTMPPFSVNDARGTRGPSRREIGHGRLAEKAIEPLIPSLEDFPYTIRCQTEIISSNGSTSMASVCATTLSLMDAGVPLPRIVSGIAMGLIIDEDNPASYVVLTDIQGLEDFMGDMDFKIAGTSLGITALQMDIKVLGITVDILAQAIEQGDGAKNRIADHLRSVSAQHRHGVKDHAPRIEQFWIEPDQVRFVIGPGGSVINDIIQKTGVKIDFTDEGRTTITSSDRDAMDRAKKMIMDIVRKPVQGDRLVGTITRIESYGLFVALTEKITGLVHIKNAAAGYVRNLHDLFTLGQRVPVIVLSIGDDGKIQLQIDEEKPATSASAGV